MYNVIKFQAPFERLKLFGISPETNLYKAIIVQAIIDVSNISESLASKKIELEARKWLFGNSDYFKEVCFNAGMEPRLVVEIAREIIKINCNKHRIRQKTSKDAINTKKPVVVNHVNSNNKHLSKFTKVKHCSQYQKKIIA